MNKDQKLEAIEQMKAHCRLVIETKDYEMLSARGTLYTLGFTSDEADSVIDLIRLGGFTNCLDPNVYMTKDGKRIYPGADVCYWGADQLLSRLQCLSIRR